MTHLDILYEHQILLTERIISVVESFYVLHAKYITKSELPPANNGAEYYIKFISSNRSHHLANRMQCTNLATGH